MGRERAVVDRRPPENARHHAGRHSTAERGLIDDAGIDHQATQFMLNGLHLIAQLEATMALDRITDPGCQCLAIVPGIRVPKHQT